jgi:hypothetical protein
MARRGRRDARSMHARPDRCEGWHGCAVVGAAGGVVAGPAAPRASATMVQTGVAARGWWVAPGGRGGPARIGMVGGMVRSAVAVGRRGSASCAGGFEGPADHRGASPARLCASRSSAISWGEPGFAQRGGGPVGRPRCSLTIHHEMRPRRFRPRVQPRSGRTSPDRDMATLSNSQIPPDIQPPDRPRRATEHVRRGRRGCRVDSVAVSDAKPRPRHDRRTPLVNRSQNGVIWTRRADLALPSGGSDR